MPEKAPVSALDTNPVLEREKIALEREMLALERERINAEREQWKIESGWQKKAASGLQVSVPVLGFAIAGTLALGIIAGYQRGSYIGYRDGKAETQKPQYVLVSTPFVELLGRVPLSAQDSAPATTQPEATFDFLEGQRRMPDAPYAGRMVLTR